LKVLGGMERRPVRYLSFEANLAEFRFEGLEGVEALEWLAQDGEFNYTRLPTWAAAEASA